MNNGGASKHNVGIAAKSFFIFEWRTRIGERGAIVVYLGRFPSRTFVVDDARGPPTTVP